MLAALALTVGAAMPLPTPPRALRLAETPRPGDAVLAGLERAASRAPDAEALRRLVEQLREGHRPLQLAIALERLHAATLDPAPLREAMGLRQQLGDATAARAAAERLALLGAATEAELLAMAEARLEQGDPGNATTFLLRHLPQQPTELVALAAAGAAQRLSDPGPALRHLGARLAVLNVAALEPLRVALMDAARPDMALALMEGLPADMQADPATAFRMAEAEARSGFPGAGLARLLALRATEGLPPGAGALLIDLALREGRLAEAFEVAALLPAESWPGALPMRLHEAARARPELLRALDPQRLAARPDAAAVIALARGDRNAARRFAQAALERPPASAEGARGVAAVLRELGQDQAAWDRLRRELDGPRPAAPTIRLFAELSALPARMPRALPVLERFRQDGPLAAEAWVRLALASGQAGEVADFLQGRSPVSAVVLAEALQFGTSQRNAALAEAAGLALRARAVLPPGWSAQEVVVMAALARPLTPGALAAGLDFLAHAGETEARQRVVLALAAAPEIGAAAAGLPILASHPALPRLRQEAEAGSDEGATARLALLAVIAPRQALALLTRRAQEAPARFGPALVLARLRGEGVASGEAALRDLLPRLPRAAQEQALFLLLAAGPAEARGMVTGIAEAVLGPGWRRGYEAALARSGPRAELVAALRSRAALPDSSAEDRREIAARLREMGESAE